MSNSTETMEKLGLAAFHFHLLSEMFHDPVKSMLDEDSNTCLDAINIVQSKDIDKYKSMCRVLFNRCRAITYHLKMEDMCKTCGMHTDCDEMHSI